MRELLTEGTHTVPFNTKWYLLENTSSPLDGTRVAAEGGVEFGLIAPTQGFMPGSATIRVRPEDEIYVDKEYSNNE